jgi:hypothetical protein
LNISKFLAWLLITVPIGQDRRKIILKLNAEILETLFFSKQKILHYGKNIGEYLRNKYLPNLIFLLKLIIWQIGANPALLI